MKYKTPELTALTPAINAVQVSERRSFFSPAPIRGTPMK